MYRGVALPATAAGATLDIRFDGDRVILDGEDVTEAIRTPEIPRRASGGRPTRTCAPRSSHKQRELIAEGDWVAEGRDIGTVVAPDAEVKVYLTRDRRRARAPARAARSRRRGARARRARRTSREPRR